MLEDATLAEAVDYFRRMSVQHDKLETEEEYIKGVNFVIKQGAARAGAKKEEARISLDLSNVPLHDALGFMAQLANVRFKIEPLAVVIGPEWGESHQFYTQTFRVPPNFLQLDPNGKQKTAVDILKAVGILFPEGASATFIAATSELVVRNTGQNMDLIQVYVDGYQEEDGKELPLEKVLFIGTKIEFEAVVHPDGLTITVATKIEKSFGEPKIEQATVVGPVSGKQLPIERVRVELGSIETRTKIFSGQTRLLGTLSPSNDDSDVTEVVLMKVWLSKMHE